MLKEEAMEWVLIFAAAWVAQGIVDKLYDQKQKQHEEIKEILEEKSLR